MHGSAAQGDDQPWERGLRGDCFEDSGACGPARSRGGTPAKEFGRRRSPPRRPTETQGITDRAELCCPPYWAPDGCGTIAAIVSCDRHSCLSKRKR